MFRRFLNFCLAAVITATYWLLFRSWRFRQERFPEKGPCVFAHWHGDELLLVGSYVGRGMAVLASQSRDGVLMGRVLGWLGYRVARGSSTRGGAGGLKGMIDFVERESCDASLAVDGPRGPIFRVKLGVLKLAQATGLPLVAAASAASRKIVFKRAWNQCYLPLPFSKCVIVYGEPVVVAPDLSDEELELKRKRIEAELMSLRVEAEYLAKEKWSLFSAREEQAGV